MISCTTTTTVTLLDCYPGLNKQPTTTDKQYFCTDEVAS